MKPFTVESVSQLRHSVSQPDFKVSAPKGASNLSGRSEKSFVELLPTVPNRPPSKRSQFLDFCPREAKNMPLAEKVSSWLHNVPWIHVGGQWVSDCYPGHVSSTSRSSSANILELKDSPSDQDIFERQARQITRIITGNYLNNGENTARPITTVLDFSDQRYSDDGYLFDYTQVDMAG